MVQGVGVKAAYHYNTRIFLKSRRKSHAGPCRLGLASVMYVPLSLSLILSPAVDSPLKSMDKICVTVGSGEIARGNTAG